MPSAGMLTMLDIVGNHASPTDGDVSFIKPFNKPEHYHSCSGCSEHCSIPDAAYASAESWPPQLPGADLVKQCRLINLADLNQTNPFVRRGLISWLRTTLQKYPFDAIRMDTVKHVQTVSFVMLWRVEYQRRGTPLVPWGIDPAKQPHALASMAHMRQGCS
jgi:alpha-amylase